MAGGDQVFGIHTDDKMLIPLLKSGVVKAVILSRLSVPQPIIQSSTNLMP